MLAQEEARLLHHNYIGTEHLLLGLLHEGEGVAGKVLAGFDVTTERVRALVREIVGEGPDNDIPVGHIPFTPRAKRVLEMSLREALQLGHNYLGTEHIVLGIVRETDSGVAFQILFDRLGLDASVVREAVIQTLSGYQVSGTAIQRPRQVDEPKCPACGTALDGRLGSRAMAATRDGEGGVDPLLVVYCRTCGRFLNVLPAAEPVQPPEEG